MCDIPTHAVAAPSYVLARLLDEDVPYGDLTTEALAIGERPARMTFVARDAMVLALAEDAAEILRLAGAERIVLQARSGQCLACGAAILSVKGSAGALLKGWKAAQTLIDVFSGVATSTRAVVDAAATGRADTIVACTRKCVPGTKRFAAAAVKAGGGSMHRFGLSESILVFAEHRLFAGSASLQAMLRQFRQRAPERKIVIEVGTIDEAVAAAQAGFDVLQLEKFTPGDVASLVERLGAGAFRPVIAAAGGIDERNAADYARAGADVLVTSAPYTARPRDVQVRFYREGDEPQD